MIRVKVLLHNAEQRLPVLARPLMGLEGYFRDLGIDWNTNRNSADLVWIHQQQLKTVSKGEPIIVHELRDSATVNWDGRDALLRQDVLSVVKVAAYRPINLINAPHYENSYHGTLIYNSASQEERPVGSPNPLAPRIPEECFNKIQLGFNWLYAMHLDSLQNSSEIARQRDIDIFFAGTMNYKRWHPSWHRKLASDAIECLPYKVLVRRGQGLPPNEYREMLYRSKIVVSPWGLGELCIRDMEAMLAGCVLIKPDSSFVTTWPDYHQMKTCIFSEPNYSDLEQVVRRILDSWIDLREECEQQAEILRRLRHPRVLSARIAKIIRDVLAY